MENNNIILLLVFFVLFSTSNLFLELGHELKIKPTTPFLCQIMKTKRQLEPSGVRVNAETFTWIQTKGFFLMNSFLCSISPDCGSMRRR